MKCYKILTTFSIFLILIILHPTFVKAKTVLMNWNEVGAEGTTWPGWTWYPGGIGQCADDFGSSGWRRDDGQFYSGDSNWYPRPTNR